jgi:hypothetical protein
VRSAVDVPNRTIPEEPVLSKSIDPGQSRLLDEVRAKIFYLANDIEPASPPAAILLRAVAEAIEASEGESAKAMEAAEAVNGRAAINGLTASLPYARANETCSPALRVPAGMPPLRKVASATEGTGQKR